MKISELFTNYNYKLIGKNIDINSLCYNSKSCKKNSLFFAIQGENRDGHNYIEDAVKNGAIGVVVEKDVKIKNNISIVKVKDSKDALSYASVKFFNNPSNKLNITGITGTNGKTTITYLLEKIFKNSAVIGTVNYRIKDKILDAPNTTPMPLELNKFLKDCVDAKIEYVFMEVSSHGIELNRVKYLNFDCCVFTNLSHEHLDFHKNLENYFNAKKKLFTEILLKSNKNNKFAVINIDNEYGRKIVKAIENKIKIITYGFSKDADVYPEKYSFSLSGIKATVIIKDKKIKISSNLIGEFNLSNILAAISVATGFNLNLEEIEKSLNKEINIPGRLEKVVKNRNYFVDYAHTPDALENVLKTLNKIKGKKRLITVFGCGGDRDKAKRPLMGYIAAKLSDFIIITSDNPRNEDPFSIIEDILKGVKKAINENYISENDYRIIPNREDAIILGIKSAKKEDILLVAGKGHEDYQIIGNKKIKFSDREVILRS